MSDAPKTCDLCGRTSWAPAGGMGGGLHPSNHEEWCINRGGMWCRVAREGRKAALAEVERDLVLARAVRLAVAEVAHDRIASHYTRDDMPGERFVGQDQIDVLHAIDIALAEDDEEVDHG